MLDCIVWQSCTLFLDLSAPSVRKELMYLLQSTTRPWQVCWKSEQKDGRGLGFGEFSIFKRLMYSPSNHAFLILQIYTTSEPNYSVFNIESINMNLGGQLLCRATENAELCEGKGCKKAPTHNYSPQNRHSCPDSIYSPNTQSRSCPQPRPPRAASQSTHFSLTTQSPHTPIFKLLLPRVHIQSAKFLLLIGASLSLKVMIYAIFHCPISSC